MAEYNEKTARLIQLTAELTSNEEVIADLDYKDDDETVVETDTSEQSDETEEIVLLVAQNSKNTVLETSEIQEKAKLSDLFKKKNKGHSFG